MFQRIDYDELERLMGQGARLIEVLPADEYEEEHIPGAISIPLKELDADSTAQLDKQKPVVTYCWDYLCDMSPRAAARLDSLGFEDVYDYAPSKVDYLARGLPTEGTKADEPRAGDFLRGDAVRCRRDAQIEEVLKQVEASPYGFALVVTDEGTLLGRLRSSALEGDPQSRVEEAMEEGPSTMRAHVPVDELKERLDRKGLKIALITTPEGTLLGVVRRADLDDARA